ncbi:hypothetical protein Rhal01_02124 [Rubritalea halochordaticola]|uniref:Uncharacterized protein n=1 Tax=Rubritalea halochordaticola TaxID=714537 RepID=A0ABP9V0C6_9BACT
MKILLLLLALIHGSALAAEEAPATTTSSIKEVEAIVSALASESPEPTAEQASSEYYLQRYSTPEVEAAMLRLNQLPPSAFPELLKHLDNQGYCYSATLPSAVGREPLWFHHTVSDVIHSALSNNYEFIGSYKSRQGTNGEPYLPLNFSHYVKTQAGLEQWVAKVSTLTRQQAYFPFLDWCIEQENQRGYKNPAMKAHILEHIDKLKKELAK